METTPRKSPRIASIAAAAAAKPPPADEQHQQQQQQQKRQVLPTTYTTIYRKKAVLPIKIRRNAKASSSSKRGTPLRRYQINTATDKTIYWELNYHDVLMGRGNVVTKWPGNANFRNTVWFFRPMYQRAANQDKTNIAQQVLDTIAKLDPPGRMYESVGGDGSGEQQGYILVEGPRALEKVCQGLREQKSKRPPDFDEWKKKNVLAKAANAKSQKPAAMQKTNPNGLAASKKSRSEKDTNAIGLVEGSKTASSKPRSKKSKPAPTVKNSSSRKCARPNRTAINTDDTTVTAAAKPTKAGVATAAPAKKKVAKKMATVAKKKRVPKTAVKPGTKPEKKTTASVKTTAKKKSSTSTKAPVKRPAPTKKRSAAPAKGTTASRKKRRVTNKKEQQQKVPTQMSLPVAANKADAFFSRQENAMTTPSPSGKKVIVKMPQRNSLRQAQRASLLEVAERNSAGSSCFPNHQRDGGINAVDDMIIPPPPTIKRAPPKSTWSRSAGMTSEHSLSDPIALAPTRGSANHPGSQHYSTIGSARSPPHGTFKTTEAMSANDKEMSEEAAAPFGGNAADRFDDIFASVHPTMSGFSNGCFSSDSFFTGAEPDQALPNLQMHQLDGRLAEDESSDPLAVCTLFTGGPAFAVPPPPPVRRFKDISRDDLSPNTVLAVDSLTALATLPVQPKTAAGTNQNVVDNNNKGYSPKQLSPSLGEIMVDPPELTANHSLSLETGWNPQRVLEEKQEEGAQEDSMISGFKDSFLF